MEFSIFTFPMEQIGWGLRQLSLSGAVGNIIAIILYVLLSLVPCAVLIGLKRTKKACKADWMLLFVSASIFYTLYYMINPGLFFELSVVMGKQVLGCTFYSVLIGYLILRILEKSAQADCITLQKGLGVLLYLVMVLFAYVVVMEFAVNLPASIQAVQAGNQLVGDWMLGDFGYGTVNLTLTYVFLVLQSVVNALPYVLDIFVLFTATKAINELLVNAYSDAAVVGVQNIAGLCSKVLAIMVIVSMCFNVAQLLCRNGLHQINITATIPVVSILLIVLILVVARYVRESQKLKRDNDLFI